MVNAEHVRLCGEHCRSFLAPHVDKDWQQRPDDIDMSVAELVAHVARAILWYAIDLSAGAPDLVAADPQVKADESNHEILRALATSVHIRALVVHAAPESARGFHPFGTADPSGFAAMSCDEMLIHTNDIASALSQTFDPPNDLVEAVLNRLFPWVRPVADPWQQLCGQTEESRCMTGRACPSGNGTAPHSTNGTPRRLREHLHSSLDEELGGETDGFHVDALIVAVETVGEYFCPHAG